MAMQVIAVTGLALPDRTGILTLFFSALFFLVYGT